MSTMGESFSVEELARLTALQESEKALFWATQTAILDSLSSQTAIVDGDGVILAVNNKEKRRKAPDHVPTLEGFDLRVVVGQSCIESIFSENASDPVDLSRSCVHCSFYARGDLNEPSCC
jgi:hypothetical protein